MNQTLPNRHVQLHKQGYAIYMRQVYICNATRQNKRVFWKGAHKMAFVINYCKLHIAHSVQASTLSARSWLWGVTWCVCWIMQGFGLGLHDVVPHLHHHLRLLDLRRTPPHSGTISNTSHSARSKHKSIGTPNEGGTQVVCLTS